MLKKITVAPIKSIAPKDGINQSKELNSAIGSLIASTDSFSQQWNTQLVDLLNTMPGGGRKVDIASRTSTPNAFTNGIDGANLYIDCATTSAIENGEFFKASANRPYTVKEYVSKVKIDLSGRLSKIESSVTLLQSIDSTGLTQAQKDAIGIRVFEPTMTSSPTSLDGYIAILRQNIRQLASDVFNYQDPSGSALDGADYTITNAQTQSLGITIMDWVQAIANATGHVLTYDVNGKPVLDHSFVITDIPQTSVQDSGAGLNDSFVGATTTLLDDLNKLRTVVKDAKGTAAWDTANTTALFGGVDDLEGITNFQGSGTGTATNIFAYDLSDLSDTTGLLSLPSFSTLNEAISIGQVVSISSVNNHVTKTSAAVASTTPGAIGIAMSATTGVGTESISVRLGSFIKAAVLVGATVGTNYYVDPASPGNLTTTIPSTSGQFIIKIGKATNATDLLVKISDEILVG